jgi:hypothetical protein
MIPVEEVEFKAKECWEAEMVKERAKNAPGFDREGC